ncbi:hypothetical protein ACFYOT_06960 [Saccharothrix saharensis]|uniref:hypothetical protein n=1 Tax=Saccharothrix saharensis TaxID=571190 RepID=UPI00368FA0F4
MTEPEPAERATPEPAAVEPAAAEPAIAEPGTTKAEAAQPDATPDTDAPAAESPAAGGSGPAGANPQELFGSLSLSAIEADIDRLMSDKMSQLDGMLAGLEDLVQRLEGEITNLETPPDEPHTPQG